MRNIDYNLIKRERANSLKKLLYIFACNDKKKREELYDGNDIMEKVNKKLEFLTDKFGNLYYDKDAYKDAVHYELGTKDGAKNKSIEIAKNLLNFGIHKNDILRFVKNNFLWYYRHTKKTRNFWFFEKYRNNVLI